MEKNGNDFKGRLEMRSFLDRVFVSGEEGMLARELICRLRERGSIILNDELPKTWISSFQPEVDMLNWRVLSMLYAMKPTCIIHAAALVNTDKCQADEQHAFQCNVETTYNLTRLWKPGIYFVYFSTTAIYSPTAPRPLTEGSEVDPFTLYGQTKWWGEIVARDTISSNALLVLRPCFIYGGERDTSSVLNKLVTQAVLGGPTVTATLDPECLKDFMYVEDFGAVAGKLIEQRATGVFNVSHGNPRPYKDALHVFEQRGLFPDVKFNAVADYLGDHVVDGTKAERETGVCTDIELEEGIDQMIKRLKT